MNTDLLIEISRYLEFDKSVINLSKIHKDIYNNRDKLRLYRVKNVKKSNGYNIRGAQFYYMQEKDISKVYNIAQIACNSINNDILKLLPDSIKNLYISKLNVKKGSEANFILPKNITNLELMDYDTKIKNIDLSQHSLRRLIINKKETTDIKIPNHNLDYFGIIMDTSSTLLHKINMLNTCNNVSLIKMLHLNNKSEFDIDISRLKNLREVVINNNIDKRFTIAQNLNIILPPSLKKFSLIVDYYPSSKCIHIKGDISSVTEMIIEVPFQDQLVYFEEYLNFKKMDLLKFVNKQIKFRVKKVKKLIVEGTLVDLSCYKRIKNLHAIYRDQSTKILEFKKTNNTKIENYISVVDKYYLDNGLLKVKEI